jgi:phytoene desaturase
MSESREAPRAIVIGAGFGGIAAAVRLRRKGYKVSLFDSQDQLGGRAYVHHRNGFTFDAGPTVLTAPFLFEELFALHGKKLSDRVELVPVYPWYSIRFSDGSTFKYGGSLEQMTAEIRKFSESDALAYPRLLEKCKKIFDVGFTRLGDQPFNSLSKMLQITPDMIGLESYLTVYQLVSKYIQNDKLRQVFTFHPLLVGGNPFNTTSIYALIHYLEREFGVWYALGGTGAIVSAFQWLLGEIGVEIRLSTEVRELEISDGAVSGIILKDGKVEKCDLCVANVDAPFLYKNMVKKQDRKKWTDKKIAALKYSMGLFVIYFGTNRTYPEVDHHTIMLGSRYEELLQDIFDRKILADDFSLYLHAPTRTDPSMAPAGCECFYVLVPVPNLQGKDLDWAQTGTQYADKILKFLESTILPGLSDSLVEKFFVTPEHFEENLSSMHGAGFSIQPTLLQSAYFRFHNQSEDVKNLYLVGAGTHPGAGLPGVLTSAKVLEHLVPQVD